MTATLLNLPERRIPNSDPMFSTIAQFLTDEAALLDDNDLGSWLDVLAPDLVYTAPVRRTVMRAQGSGFDETVTHYAEDIESIGFRIRRFLDSENAFADDPPSRTRRHITSVAVWGTEGSDEYRVRSNLLVTRSRWDAPNFDLISGRREDLVRLGDDGPRLASRTVYLDQATLGTPNLSIFL